MIQLDLRTQSPEAIEVEVELAQAQIAPARRGDLGLAEAGGERSEDHDGSPHLAHQLVGGAVGVDIRGVYLEGVPVKVGVGPQAFEDGEHRVDVLDARHVAQGSRTGRQK